MLQGSDLTKIQQCMYFILHREQEMHLFLKGLSNWTEMGWKWRGWIEHNEEKNTLCQWQVTVHFISTFR